MTTKFKLKKGDEVITASNTAIPTVSAIVNSGAKPVLVDINDDYLIDIDKLKKAITSKTKAIIPVHLYGKPCEIDKVLNICKKRKIHLIEDCAQSQGAKFKNKYVGTFGSFGCFSFYPTKILGAYGDGGFILTNSFDAYKKIKRLRFYGIETVENSKFKNEYYANENGVNSRLDEIQASILNNKLPIRDFWIFTGIVVDYFQSFFFLLFGESWKSYVFHASFINILVSLSFYFFFTEFKFKPKFS